MSVPKWRQTVSKTQYLNLLYELNIKMGHIVNNASKKYKTNYGDVLIKDCVNALQYAQLANSIFMSSQTPQSDYELRRECLLKVRGYAEIIPTISYIYLELLKDGGKYKQIVNLEEYISDTCSNIHKMVSGGFEFLKKRIFISDTGKIVMRLMRKNITKRRQLIKKHIELYYKGQITFQSLCQSYDSWVGYASHYNAYKTILSMDKLFIDLFRKGNT